MNAQKIAILTDTAADLLPEMLERYPIYQVPYTITFSDGSYQDGIDIFPADIYRKQVDEMPKTSLPSGQVIADALQKIKDAGYEKVISVMLSSGLSGCYQLTRMLAMECEGLEVFCYDTLSGSLGQAAIVLTLCRMIEEGKTWEQLVDIVPRLCKNTFPYFTVDTLEYLQRGGRIGRITALAGTALGIKPIIAFDSETGELTSIHKVRGRAAAMKKLVQVAASNIVSGKRYNIMWAHGGSPEEGDQIAQMLREAAPDFVHEYHGEIDCTLACYVGPKLIGAAVQVLDDDM